MLTVDGLSFTYPGTPAAALSDLSFAIAPGEVFGFLGPSGAGKSTTQKILTGLLHGYRGSVRVLGRDLAGWGRAYYERIGVCFELPNHFLALTARENLAYFAALYRRGARPAAEMLALVGLEQDIDTPVARFSKGMKIRLNLARALQHQPELLFLDEPTSGLDPSSAQRVKDLIRAEQAAGRTIFLTTHNMQLADDLCDRVAFLVDGAIRLIDSPRALKLRFGEARVRVEHATPAGAQSREFPLAGLGESQEFLGLLRDGAVQTIHSREASLEDIFIRVTGRALA